MARDTRILAGLVKRMKNRDADPLRPLIDEYFIRRDLVPPEQRYQEHTFPLVARHRPPGRLSPSTVGGCMRQAAFKFIGVPARRFLDPDLEAIFEQGNWIHHKWQAIFKDMQMVLGKDQIEVLSTEKGITYPRLYIAGTSDNTLRLLGEKVVVDEKSIQDYGFTQIFTSDEPKDEHKSQLHPYMKGHRIYSGLLHYENKNNQRTRTFRVPFEPERWEWLQDWCKQVLRRMMRKELPPMHPDCDAGNFLFEQCPWKGVCFGRKEGEALRESVYLGFPGVKKQWALAANKVDEDDPE
jgi:hypothetical protein